MQPFPVIKLSTNSEVFSGYSFRKQLKISEVPMFGVIQLKDVDALTGQIDYQNLITILEFEGSNKYILQKGDILIIARGNSTRAIIFDMEKSAFPLLASGAFIIVRPKQESLIPAYVAWFLNLPESQMIFKRAQVKTTVQNLSIDVLREFEIKVPPIHLQQLIGETYLLHQEEIRISKLRDEKRTLLLNEKIKNIL